MQEYFPLNTEREIERERHKDELIKEDFRYAMEEAQRLIKEQYTDEIPYTPMRQPHPK